MFEDFKLLAGESGITNQITGVNILDNPKATDWLSPGELIVTSGYFFKESPEALIHFLESFSRLNIAAVCIKPKIYLNPLPKKLIKLCDELAIPLIEIPYGVAFSKIMHTVMNLLADSASETAQMALDINSKFMEYGLQGEGIDYLKQKLESFLGNPLIITNADWSLLANQPASAFYPYLRQQKSIAFFNQTLLSSIPTNVSQLKHPTHFVFKDGVNGVLLPIFFNEVTYGYIIVLPHQRPLSQKDYIVLENSSIAIALKIVHQAEKERINNKVLRDFYRELLFGTKTIEELRSFDIEFDYDLAYVVFILSIETSSKSNDLLQQKYDEDLLMRTILNAVNHYQITSHFDLPVFKQGQQVIGLVGHRDEVMSNETQQHKFFTEFHQYLLSFLANDAQVTIFIGSVQKLAELNQSYQEAKQMIAYQTHTQNQLYFAKEFYLENFLYRHINQPDAYNLIEHYLSPLLTYDRETDSHLIETLDVYLQQQQNLAATSRLLFIHRNTLLYRIEKIENLLGCSLTTPATAFNLTFALKLHKQYPKA
jgi:sugar diacid utilization regulator